MEKTFTHVLLLYSNIVIANVHGRESTEQQNKVGIPRSPMKAPKLMQQRRYLAIRAVYQQKPDILPMARIVGEEWLTVRILGDDAQHRRADRQVTATILLVHPKNKLTPNSPYLLFPQNTTI